MSMQLQARVSALEETVKELRQVIDSLLQIIMDAKPAVAVNPNGPRQLCPKCHEKPAYHFHVQNCTGKKAAA